ncbi:MAG: zinc-binding protein [Thermoproteota archaeon]
MGRRRRKYRKRIPVSVPRRLPTVYECPNCGARALSVTINKKVRNEAGEVEAVIKCGKCGLVATMFVPSIYEAVDAYSKFLDKFLEGKVEVKFAETEEATLSLAELEMEAEEGGEGEYEER